MWWLGLLQQLMTPLSGVPPEKNMRITWEHDLAYMVGLRSSQALTRVKQAV